MDSRGEAYQLYRRARERLAAGEIEAAAELFERSARLAPHFKTLEPLGECLAALDRRPEAVVPLAAAATLNRGGRAPALLAEVLLKLGEWHDALQVAELALARDPRNRKARSIREQAAARLAGPTPEAREVPGERGDAP